MASNLVKKKNVSPSHSQSTVNSNQARRKSLGSPSLTGITEQRPSEKKVVPNYLKPTISSRNDSFKYVQKQAPEDGVSKPVLNRRRSFDHPFSPSRIDKSFDSPGPRERAANVPSSSLAKSVFPASGKQGSLDSRGSKSLKYGLKSHAVSVKSRGRKDASASSDDCRRTETEVEGSVQQVERAEIDFSVSPEIPATEAIVGNETTVEKNEEADNVDCIKIEASEGNSLTGGKKESEEKLHEDEGKIVDREEEEEDEDEEEEEIPKVDEASFEAETKKISTDKVAEAVVQDTAGDEEDKGFVSKERNDGEEEKLIISEEGKETEKWDEVLSEHHDRGQGRNEGEETESGTEETKQNMGVESSKRHGQGHGKKDATAYNDVIEETVSKLMEKRKNRVKALVGAFETVIDYEASSKYD